MQVGPQRSGCNNGLVVWRGSTVPQSRLLQIGKYFRLKETFLNVPFLLTGRVEGTEACHAHAFNRECHLWNLLDHRYNSAQLGYLWL